MRRLAHLATLTFLLFGCSSEADRLDQPVLSGTSCKTSDDCQGAKPFCDAASSQCVECLFDTQCTGEARCRATSCVVPSACATSLDCVGVSDAMICDPATATCVSCVDGADCPGTADCLRNVCVPYDACTTSLDCPTGKVCDRAASRCVTCVGNEDCPDGNVCVGNKCEIRIECASDNQCTPHGKLCAKDLGYCVDCITNAHCPEFHHCDGGACVVNTCDVGSTKCQGNAVAVCSASGESWGPSQPCPQGTSCTMTAGVAACASTLCTAGSSYCDGDKALTCAADGMSVATIVDCSATGKHCVGGQCTDQACAPNTIYCSGQEIRQCNGTGTGYVVQQTCGTQQTCDPTTVSCVAQACTPGALACQGSVATTCNSAGTGYAPGGTDCALQGKSCSAGSCIDCSPGGVAPTAVRMKEAFLGSVDYLLLSNRGDCAAQLDTLSIRINSNKPSSMDFDLPSWLLAPGAEVYVIYKSSAATDIVAPDLANFLLPSQSEWVALCEGPCSGGVILDYFAHANAGLPPTAPAGVSFLPEPLPGIDIFSQNTSAYTRQAYTGDFPTFVASDWKIAAASRPQ